MSVQTLRYGDHPDQYVQCRAAAGRPRGTAVLVHGGYWRERHTLDLMRPLADRLAAAGWATANVEYRRGPAAAWPAPLDDVRAACAAAAEWADDGGARVEDAADDGGTRPGGSLPLVAVGHSVGGQLALLVAGSVDAVVALAPVTNAARTHAERLGDDAAQEYFGAGPGTAPAVYVDASPLARVPVGRPVLLVHGATDERVPLRHSLDYLVAALEAGDRVDTLLPHDLDHLAAVDPARPFWAHVEEWMGGVAASPARRGAGAGRVPV